MGIQRVQKALHRKSAGITTRPSRKNQKVLGDYAARGSRFEGPRFEGKPEDPNSAAIKRQAGWAGIEPSLQTTHP
jgi:hypothetical protein